MRFFLTILGLLLLVTACRREEVRVQRTSGFEDFLPQYNRYIRNWLGQQREGTINELREAEAKLGAAEGEDREALERQITTLKLDQEKWDFRLGLGDFFRIATPGDVPADLVWKDGMDQPEIGDPDAKKGGVFRTWIPSFPPTLRPFGDNSNNSFRGEIYDNIDMPLVGLHPATMEMIPGLAVQWAVSTDRRTTYFRLNKEARYSDGVPVKARDFLYGSYLRISDDIVNPYAKQYYKENLAQVAMYDDMTLSISMPEAQLFAPVIAGSLSPSPPHFYTDYGPDYTERYQWEFPPTTGAYEVKPEDVVKGVSITQSRVNNWWAKDRKYYKHRFNPDRVVHLVVRDESKAFELFRAGELDTYDVTRPELWYEKSEIEPVYSGYIERVTFYNQYPALPRGLYLNVSKPLLNELPVRIGIQHAINWQKVIDVMFRGDYKRLSAFNEGFIGISDPSIEARKYSVSKARLAFREAGFTQTGRDGILKRPDGTRLSISVSYPSLPILDRIFAILREEALATGLELRLDGQEATVNYKKTMQKQHDMAMASWQIGPPVPDFYQFLHSSNARDDKGNLKPQTNNLFAWGRADTDRLSERVRTATSLEELREAVQALQKIIHEEAIFVPAYKVDFVRVAFWRWVRWPDSEETKFSPPVVYDPLEAFVYWIDVELQEDTLAARRSGEVFPEVNRVVEDYRTSGSDEDEEQTEEEAAPEAEEPTMNAVEDSEASEPLDEEVGDE